MAEALKRLGKGRAKVKNEIIAVFTTQEEVGTRGAMGAAFDSDADAVIVLEGTTAGDMGDVPEAQRVCEVGKGVVVSFMDRASIADGELYQRLMGLAREKEITHQIKRGATGGNDADFAMVFAVTDKEKGANGGVTCFLVDRDMYHETGTARGIGLLQNPVLLAGTPRNRLVLALDDAQHICALHHHVTDLHENLRP